MELRRFEFHDKEIFSVRRMLNLIADLDFVCARYSRNHKSPSDSKRASLEGFDTRCHVTTKAFGSTPSSVVGLHVTYRVTLARNAMTGGRMRYLGCCSGFLRTAKNVATANGYLVQELFDREKLKKIIPKFNLLVSKNQD